MPPILSTLSLLLPADPLLNPRSRRAFPTTKRLLRLMAAAPNMGFSFTPNTGYHTPAAKGIPIAL